MSLQGWSMFTEQRWRLTFREGKHVFYIISGTLIWLRLQSKTTPKQSGSLKYVEQVWTTESSEWQQNIVYASWCLQWRKVFKTTLFWVNCIRIHDTKTHFCSKAHLGSEPTDVMCLRRKRLEYSSYPSFSSVVLFLSSSDINKLSRQSSIFKRMPLSLLNTAESILIQCYLSPGLYTEQPES